jgi:uncharacterized radical SAM superfamily Fe-S cluster-containing enzyme
VQFSGGEPSIHPQIVEMMQAAAERNIRHIMLNTNGKRIARDDNFVPGPLMNMSLTLRRQG